MARSADPAGAGSSVQPTVPIANDRASRIPALSIGRRRALLGAVTAGLGPLPAWAQAAAASEGASLLVAGPSGGRLDLLAASLAPAMSRALPGARPMRLVTSGGADGVTGANQFAARADPDGTTGLLVPGEAVIAWLAGDPRARFETAHWIPVLAGVAPALLVSRVPPAALPAGARLRVAVSAPVGPELPALLALDLLGISPVAVLGMHEPSQAMAALGARVADAVVLHGPGAADRLAEATVMGAAPVLSIGMEDSPLAPGLMGLARQLRRTLTGGPLLMACRATAAAVRLEFALVLPQLTPAAQVAAWRRAAATAIAAQEVIAAAPGVRLTAGPGVAGVPGPLAADAAALEALRQWLGMRLGWRAG